MNQKILTKMLLFMFCTFSFVQILSMTTNNSATRLLINNRFSKIFLFNQAKSYSSKIPFEQSNKALQIVIQEKQKSKKTEWHKLIDALSIISISFLCFDQIIKLIKTKDVKNTNPEIYNLFLKIKQDVGITENISLRITDQDHLWIENCDAVYSCSLSLIILNKNLFHEQENPSVLKLGMNASQL